MPEINFNKAKEILENIEANDKVAVIHHDDGDGFCSGILYYEWCKNKDANVKEFTYSIGDSRLEDFNLKPFNKIIITDLASGLMTKELPEINNEKEILFLDHHPHEGDFPNNVSYLITTSQGYLPASRTAGELTKLNPLLSLIGTITDMGYLYPENEEFIEKHLKDFNMDIEEFKEKISSKISNTLTFFDKDYHKAFEKIREIKTISDISKIEQYSKPIEEEITFFLNDYEKNHEKLGDINFYILEPKYKIKGIVANILSHKTGEGTFIFASRDRSDENQITFSARTNEDKYNMADLLRAGTKNLENANAGGHPRAAGGMIKIKDLDKFKENIRQYLQK